MRKHETKIFADLEITVSRHPPLEALPLLDKISASKTAALLHAAELLKHSFVVLASEDGKRKRFDLSSRKAIDEVFEDRTDVLVSHVLPFVIEVNFGAFRGGKRNADTAAPAEEPAADASSSI